MKNRLFSVLILLPSLALMLGAAPAPLIEANAQAPTAPSKQTVPTGTAIIWCGLYNGSNFNVTDSCENIGTDKQPQPTYGYNVINSEPTSQDSGYVTIYTNSDGAVSTTPPPSYGYTVVNNTEPTQTSGSVTVVHKSTSTTPTSSNSSGSVSHVNVNGQTVPTATAIIWCGLYNGSNFNITDSCENIGDTDNNPQPSYGYTVINGDGSSTSTSSCSDSCQSSSSPSYGYQVVNGDGSSTTTTSSSSSSSNSSQVSVNGQTVPTATAIIWCGLWNGSNFNVTDSCANIGSNQSSQSQPADPPATAQTTSSSSSTPKDPPEVGNTYAALGDSVAAGLGLPLPTSTDSSTTACGRSTEGYPNLVATSMGISLNNVSCSGSTIPDLYSKQNANGVEQQAQIDQAFAQGTPKYLSITSGANDMNWSYFLQQCITGNCANVENTGAVDVMLTTLQANLHTALGDIKSKSNDSPPETAVTGYYQPIASDCVQSGSQLTAGDVNWIQSAVNALNQTIMQTVQQYSFAHYVPVSFTGHDACSNDPWVQTLSSAAPFHPTEAGQSEIAKDVTAAFGH